jgi:hypothetical protein
MDLIQLEDEAIIEAVGFILFVLVAQTNAMIPTISTPHDVTETTLKEEELFFAFEGNDIFNCSRRLCLTCIICEKLTMFMSDLKGINYYFIYISFCNKGIMIKT